MEQKYNEEKQSGFRVGGSCADNLFSKKKIE